MGSEGPTPEAGREPLLELSGVVAGYHRKVVLRGVNLRVEPGEIVALIGHNGSGKSTTVKSVFGMLPIREGTISFGGRAIANRAPSLNVQDGLSFVPQGRSIFSDLTVEENLRLGAYALSVPQSASLAERLGEVYQLFPILRERRRQQAGLMSGGQQQQLALGIALMLRPRLLLLDEPSVGLAPVLVQRVMDSLLEINARFGTAVLLAEQNVKQALRVSSRVYVMKLGQVALEDRSANVLVDGDLWRLF